MGGVEPSEVGGESGHDDDVNLVAREIPELVGIRTQTVNVFL